MVRGGSIPHEFSVETHVIIPVLFRYILMSIGTLSKNYWFK